MINVQLRLRHSIELKLSKVLSDACTCYAAAAALVEKTKLLNCSAKDELDKVIPVKC